jgi:hypothetical protein
MASMTPRGALRLNPQLLSDELDKDFEEVYSPERVRLGKARPISEKDEYSSSVAPTEPDAKHEMSYDGHSIASPTTPASHTSPIGHHSPNSQVSGVFNSADDRERVLKRQRSADSKLIGTSRETRPRRTSTSTPRERQDALFETRVHMPTGIRVDLNVSARALPHPPPPPSPFSPHSPVISSPVVPSPVLPRTHTHF